jgi:hypothetical protein
MVRHFLRSTGGAAVLALLAMGPGAHADQATSFVNTLANQPSVSVSTTPGTGPSAGDQNPYGVAVVPAGFPADGALKPGDMIVSNFNNRGNLQGTGTTIMAVSPSGHASTFFAAPASLAPVGLTTALVAPRSGLVVVGNTSTRDGTIDTISNGSLIFIDEHGNVVLNLVDSALLQGPWDMAADDSRPDSPILYVSNVLSGTVTRINLHVDRTGGALTPRIGSLTQIASGFLHRSDPAAVVVGPTGLLLADENTLYVATPATTACRSFTGSETQTMTSVREERSSRERPCRGRWPWHDRRSALSSHQTVTQSLPASSQTW